MTDVEKSPAEKVDGLHGEIDGRIRTMAAFVWVLVCLAFLIIICCVVSWIMISMDLKKDKATVSLAWKKICRIVTMIVHILMDKITFQKDHINHQQMI